MCAPIAIAAIGLALTAASTYAEYDNAQTNAKAQTKFNQAQANEGSALANESLKAQANATNLRIQQESEASQNQIFNNDKRAAQAVASARVSSGEAGVSGVSVDQLYADFNRQKAGYDQSVNENLGFTTQQLTSDLKGQAAQATGRINSFKRPGVNDPSYIASGLEFGGAAVNTYRQYRYDVRNG
jgi:hypothetical protein